jgi:hypothetical protein
MTTKIKSGVISDNAITSAHISSGAISSAHLSSIDTDAVSEGSSNLYFTTARARTSFSITDSGGDGSLAYDNSTGIITYTGPSASEVRAHLSAGTGVTYSSGEISIGQSVATSASPTFADINITGDLNLTGDINSYSVTDLDIVDQTITLGVGQNEAASDGSGIVIAGSSASILWDEPNDEFDFNKGINVAGNITGTLATAAQPNITSVGTLSALTVTGEITANGGIALGDNDKATFGADDNLQIYHVADSSNYVSTSSGNLILQNESDNQDILIKSDDGAGGLANYIQADGSTGEVRLYHYGSEKFNTTSTGIDVTGTATMDGLTVDGSSILNAIDTATNTVSTGLKIGHKTSGTTANGFGSALEFEVENSTYSTIPVLAKIESVSTDEIMVHSDLNFYTKYNNSLQKRMSFNNGGDISFYDDTGTSQALFWDASAERLGIGTTSPDRSLHITETTGGKIRLERNDTTLGSGNTLGIIEFETNDTDNAGVAASFSAVGESGAGAVGLQFTTGTASSNTERVRIDSSGNVGIGTDSPVAKLDVLGTSGGPTVYDYAYATNSGLRIHGDESAIDIVGTDSNNHASSVLLRNGNEGFAFINNSTSDRLELKSFNATADAFTVHSTGTNVSNLTDILTLEKTGNVGIGTTSIGKTLTVGGSGLRVQSTASADFYSTGQDALVVNNGTANLRFWNNAAERMRIDSLGQLFIGGTSGTAIPNLDKGVFLQSATEGDVLGYNLYANEGTNNRRASFFLDDTNGVYGFDTSASTGVAEFVIRRAGSEKLRIDSSGNVGIGTTSPEVKLHLFKGESNGAAANTDSSLVLENSSSTYLQFLTPTTTESGLLFGDTDNDVGALTYSHNTNTLAFRTNGVSNRMIIDSSGNVGIGLTNPSDYYADNLVVSSATENGITIAATATNAANYLMFADGTTGDEQYRGYLAYGHASDELTLRSAGFTSFMTGGGTERMRIFNNGRVKIGGSFNGVNAGLHVANADIRCTAAAIANDANSISMSQESVGGVITCRGPSTSTRGSLYLSVNQSNGGGGRTGFKIDNLGLIYAEHMGSGGATTDVNYNTSTGEIYQVTSSQRYKENISEYTDSILEKVNNLTVKNFDYKEGGYTNQVGLIAEEVEEQIPYLVNKKEIEGYDEPQPDSVKYSQLSVFLLKAIQEQQTIIDDLKSRLDEAGL